MEFYFPKIKIRELFAHAGILRHQVVNFGVELKDERGILLVQITTAARLANGETVFRLDMTARGPSEDRDTWFTSAHDTILETFDSMLSEDAKKIWIGE